MVLLASITTNERIVSNFAEKIAIFDKKYFDWTDFFL
jgi:hypothetical protein